MISYNSSGIIRLTFDIPNSEVQNISAGNPIQFYNASLSEPGFIPIGAAMHYVQGVNDFEINQPGCYILNSPGIVCSYVAPISTLLISNEQSIVFLTGYEAAGPVYSSPDDYRKLSIGFDGNYVSGDGNLKITLFGFYQ